MIKFNGTNLNEYLIITHEKEVNNIIEQFSVIIMEFNIL